MKKTLTIILFLVCNICAFGQDWMLENKGYKYWTDGPLTEDDFQVRKVSDLVNDNSDRLPGYLEWSIDFKEETAKFGNLRMKYTESETMMDQIQSWVNQDVSRKQALDFLQTEFNIVEAYRRRFQDQLNANPYGYRQIRDLSQRQLASALDAFHMETAYGYDAVALAKYQVQYEEELDSWQETPVTAPAVLDNRYGVRFFAGYSSQIFGNGLSRYLGPTHGMDIGYEFIYKKLNFGLSLYIGSAGQLKEGNFYYDSDKDYNWQKGVNCSSGLALIDLGYTILDKPAFSLRPEFDFGVSFIDQKFPAEFKTEGGNNNSELASFYIQAGMNVGIKLKRALSLTYGNYYYRETSLTFKVFGAHSNFTGIGPVNSINLGLLLDFGFFTDTSFFFL